MAGNFLYASNRGHDRINCYTVNTAAGELTSNGIIASVPRRNALCPARGTGTSTRLARIRAKWPPSASILILAC